MLTVTILTASSEPIRHLSRYPRPREPIGEAEILSSDAIRQLARSIRNVVRVCRRIHSKGIKNILLDIPSQWGPGGNHFWEVRKRVVHEVVILESLDWVERCETACEHGALGL